MIDVQLREMIVVQLVGSSILVDLSIWVAVCSHSLAGPLAPAHSNLNSQLRISVPSRFVAVA